MQAFGAVLEVSGQAPVHTFKEVGRVNHVCVYKHDPVGICFFKLPAMRIPYMLGVEPENTEHAIEIIGHVAEAKSLLVFGAAHPGQPGRHHVNCRTKEDWSQLLWTAGFYLHEPATKLYLETLKQGGITKGCYVDNTQCYFKD